MSSSLNTATPSASDKNDSRKPASSVPAIDKMCLILDLITESPFPLTSAEISNQLALPRSSTHTILQSLLSRNLVFKDRDNRFHLGSYLLYWAGKYEHQHTVIQLFHDLINQYPALLKHSVTLSKLVGKEVVVLACHESPEPLGFTFRAGVHVPAVFAATGKAMLATYSDDALAEMYLDQMPTPLTSCGVTTLAELQAELTIIRKSGISLDNGQLREGMYCMGTCIRDSTGTAIAGMAVSFLKQEYQQNKEEVSDALLALSLAITARLGTATAA